MRSGWWCSTTSAASSTSACDIPRRRSTRCYARSTTTTQRCAAISSKMASSPGRTTSIGAPAATSTSDHLARSVPGRRRQVLVHRPTGGTAPRAVVVRHAWIVEQPVAPGQPARLGVLSAQQLCGELVPLDRGTLRCSLVGEAAHMHRLVSEHVHRDDLVVGWSAFVGVAVGVERLARAAFDEGAMLRHTVRGEPDVAELRAQVAELLPQRLAAHGRRRANQPSGNGRQRTLLTVAEVSGYDGRYREYAEESDADVGKRLFAPERIDTCRPPARGKDSRASGEHD